MWRQTPDLLGSAKAAPWMYWTEICELKCERYKGFTFPYVF